MLCRPDNGASCKRKQTSVGDFSINFNMNLIILIGSLLLCDISGSYYHGLKMTFFWDITAFSLVDIDGHFRSVYCLCH
jgi:hypothetical protein